MSAESTTETRRECVRCGTTEDLETFKAERNKILRLLETADGSFSPEFIAEYAQFTREILAAGNDSGPYRNLLFREVGPLCPQCLSAIIKHQREFRALFPTNPDPNQMVEQYDGSFLPILVVACQWPWGQEDFIRELLAAGAKIHNGLRTSPVWEAVDSDSPKTMSLLYEYGAQINPMPTNDYGLTPLHWAVERKCLKALEWLADHGADLESPDCNGRTALHVAAIGENSEAVEILLDHGAAINPVDRNGRTPVRAAAKTMRLGPLAVLLRRGAAGGLKRDQWENMFGMAETMLRYAREDYGELIRRREDEARREAARLNCYQDRHEVRLKKRDEVSPGAESEAGQSRLADRLDDDNERNGRGWEERHYLPLIEKRQAVYDLLLQYKPGA